jgi:hypothetical protein
MNYYPMRWDYMFIPSAICFAFFIFFILEKNLDLPFSRHGATRVCNVISSSGTHRNLTLLFLKSTTGPISSI